MEQTKIEIKAVLFDLGETLVNFGQIKKIDIFRQGARLTYDFLRGCGVKTGSFWWYSWYNLILLRMRNMLSGITGNDFNAMEFLKQDGARRGIELSDEQWDELVWLWYEPLTRVAEVEDDLGQTLKKLKDKGLKLGILSNTFITASVIERHLSQLGLLDYFDVKLYSYQFDFRKPDWRIFVHAADAIGLRLPNIMYVGDRINKDIRPGLKVGMTTVLKRAYTNIAKKAPQGAFLITQLAELPKLIERFSGAERKVKL